MHKRNAFTLIEILIVVVIMAILAATVIPQLSDSTKDAKQSTLEFNLHTLRSQIELYKVQHLGKPPKLDQVNFTLPGLLTTTDAQGNTGTGPDYPYGPYLSEIPPNPFDGSNQVVPASGNPPTGPGNPVGGWQYDPNTGEIWPNHADWTP